MTAESMHRLGFLLGTVGRDPEDPARQSQRPPAVGDLLREWRAAERALAELDPTTDAWALLTAEVDRLRQRYQEAFKSMSNPDQSGPSA